MYLSEAGKLCLPLPFRDLVISLAQADNFDLGTNDMQLHDRLIVAQARVSGRPLITGDDGIHESGLVRTIWD